MLDVSTKNRSSWCHRSVLWLPLAITVIGATWKPSSTTYFLAMGCDNLICKTGLSGVRLHLDTIPFTDKQPLLLDDNITIYTSMVQYFQIFLPQFFGDNIQNDLQTLVHTTLAKQTTSSGQYSRHTSSFCKLLGCIIIS